MGAGVSKVRYSRGDWLNGETLGFYVARDDVEQLYLGDPSHKIAMVLCWQRPHKMLVLQ